MMLIRSFTALFVLILAGLVLSASTPHMAAADVVAPRPATDIGVIHFRGGRLVQSTEQWGRWFEKRNNGKINYEFFETASTANSIELTGPSGEVKLYVDLANKVIKGQWPGQAPIKIYTITKIERLVFPQLPAKPYPADCDLPHPDPALPCPVIPGQPPVVTPPLPHPSAPSPNPKNLYSATYVGGQFMRVADTVWEQSTQTGETFHFQVVGYDDVSLYLYDAGRQTFVTLEPQSKQSRIAVGADYLRVFHPLTAVSGSPQTPIPSQPDGTLNQDERVACLKRGGFVERAGLLGAERCTTPYNDGGLVCTDSSQCQGQCRADLNSTMGAAVTGVCQANDNPFGCFSKVVNGQAGPGLCVD